MYVFDTSVYLDAAEQPSFAEEAASFIERADHQFAVSSVVIAELLIGLTDEDQRGEMLAKVYGGKETSLLTPTHQDWEHAGDALRNLGGSTATPRRSFWNDLLIAATCARTDSVLITSRMDDFRRIARQIPVLYVAPWPDR